MSERVRQLLNEAVVGVEPRAADPVAAVLGRARHSRRRRVAGGSVLTAGLLVVAVVAVGTLRLDRAEPPPTRFATPVPGPVTVTVENGVVRAGGLRLPVPPGWTVVTANQPFCETARRTLFINSRPTSGGSCTEGPPIITVDGTADSRVVRAGASWQQMILPGGQPAWLSGIGASALDPTQPGSEYRTLGMDLPWSGVAVTFLMTRAELQPIVASIRTDPVRPGPLVLPAGAVKAVISTGVRGPAEATITDPSRVEDLRATLAGLREPAPADTGCPAETPLRHITFIDADGAVLAAVMVSMTAACSEATSSRGGRVTVPAGLWGPLAGKVTR